MCTRLSPPSSFPSKRNFFGCPSGLHRILRFFLRISSVILSSFHSCFPSFCSLLYKILLNHAYCLSLSLSLFLSSFRRPKKKKVSSVQKLVLKHDDRLHVRQYRPLLYNISTSDTVSYKYRTHLLYIIVVSVTITQLQRMRVTRIAMI